MFDAARPVILNGIEDMVRRPDLADRSLFLTLEAIPENRRRPQAELWAAFEAERPRILGGLLDAAVEGLKRLPATRLPNLPRMADFALWVTACEMALWPAGTFWALLVETTKEVDVRVARSKNWPDSPEALSGRVRRAATFLRKGGIEIVFDRQGKERTRTIIITNTNIQPSATGKGPSAPSAPSAPSSYVRTPPGNGQDVLSKLGFGPLADGQDANFPIQSGPGKPTTSG